MKKVETHRKLTFNDAVEIRRKYKEDTTMTYKILAKIYQVPIPRISEIVNRKTYTSENCNDNRRLLTFKDAQDIRQRYLKTDITQKELAEDYNVSMSTISNIIHKRTYKAE